MLIHYYPTFTAAEAFEAASMDTYHWDRIELDALTTVASEFQRGFVPTMTIGSALICPCAQGVFLLFEHAVKGYGIALLLLYGHEGGTVDDEAIENRESLTNVC